MKAPMTPNQGTVVEAVRTEGDARQPAPAPGACDGGDSQDVAGAVVESVPVSEGAAPGVGGPAARSYGPNVWETSPAYAMGWAGSSIAGAITALTDVLDDPHVLRVTDGDDEERREAVIRHRCRLELRLRSLHEALDVLDPTGTSPCRERVAVEA